MRKSLMLAVFVFVLTPIIAQIQLKIPGLKYDDNYNFNKSNTFKVDFYAKNNALKRSMTYKTYFQSNGDNFCVKLVDDGRGNAVETLFDKNREIVIQVFGAGTQSAYYNACAYKYPDENNMKKLELVPTNETKTILGYNCKRYTYTYKKIFGEAWITDQIKMSNDYGIFRSAKMSALHNTLSVGGFVLEMTSEDSKGGKTVMTTTVLNATEKFSLDLKGVNMNSSINKVNYYTF